CCPTSSVGAHDFWIEPSTFRPVTGAVVTTTLLVGQQFAGDPVARDSSQIDRFVVRDAGGERFVGGFEGHNPAGIVRMENGTAAVVGYRSKPAFLSMPPEKFEQYLRDEGLDTVLAARTQRGESKQPSREIYSRCAKTLLGVRGDFSRPFGFRLELTPESLAANRVVVRLDYESHPLANALVIAMHRDDPSLRIRVRSDAHGRAAFSLPKPGVWLIKSVHMIDARPSSGAEWESLWASLTFEN
ncbi:MAG TPA: DUF4198 domain-containing protein, partial [Thermoanaerobaculia bacterium]